MENLLSVNEAQSRILSSINPGIIEEIAIEKTLHRILAQDIFANMDFPAEDLSSMDGYVVRCEDIQAADMDHPVSLEVIGEIPAGKYPDFSLQPRQAARIMTGATLPEGGDTVIPFEEISPPDQFAESKNAESLNITTTYPRGRNVRPRGQDLQYGTQILPKHHRLEPQDIGMLAMTGISKINVFAKPGVGIFSTGDELISPGQPHLPGQIYESNSYMLASLVEKYGGHPVLARKAADNPVVIEGSLNELAATNVDIILSTGGVSVGTHDYVRQVILSAGKIEFWKVDIRPGKPLVFGNYKGIPYFGLPGNPVSSFVSFFVFVLPALRKLLGLPPLVRDCVKVVLEQPIQSDGRESYLRAGLSRRNGVLLANLPHHQGSGNLFSLVQADALLIIPSGVKSLPAGTEVDAWIINGKN